MSESFKNVDIIGVPLDLGANIRGAVAGPAAIRIAKLKKKIEVLGHSPQDLGDVYVPIRESISRDDRELKYLHSIRDVCATLSDYTYRSREKGHLPITIGGDHSLAIGSLAGSAKYSKEKGESLGLVWIDAHADLNTPDSSPSGNIHGMPMSVLLGNGHKDLTSIGFDGPKIKAENIALIGIRTIDGAEREILKASGVNYYTMREIDERGMFTVMREALEHVKKGTSGVHLSCDLDGIDPLYAPGVSTAETGGLSYREAHLICEMMHDQCEITSMDFVEVNPFTDISNKTAKLAVELIQSALGKSIT
ncbi:arginase [Oligoflexaceae bacterium]|nr:arginase [Oligoflexaceae bacterium]